MKISPVLLLVFFCVGTIVVPPAHGFDGKWQFVTNYEGVDLHRARGAKKGFLPFRATAELNIPFQQIVQALVDAEQKQTWAPKLKFTTLHSQSSATSFEYSEYYTTPWPFEDREFLLKGTVTYEKDFVFFSAVNLANKHLADANHTLVNVEVLEFAIIPLAETRSRVEFTFSGDLGGWIPGFVKTIIQKNGPYGSFRPLRAISEKVQI